GLLLTRPGGGVAARLVGSAAALTIVRRSPTVKLLWNLALFTAETSTAIAIARFALADGAPDDLASWSLLSAAILAAEVVGLVAVPLVIMLFDRELQPGLFAQIGRSHLIALVGATFAVVVAGAILHTPALALFAITPVLGVAGLLHVHGRLSKEHHDLQQLHGFTAAIGGRDSLDAGLRELTSILRTRGSALAIRRDDTYQVRCFVSGSLIDRQMTASGQPLDLGSGVAVVSADPRSEHPADDTSRRLLECVRGRSGLATPVALSSQESGLLLVFDRLGATTRYAPEERQLFASMATTLGARMSADLLLDRLELQAREDGLTGLANRAALENALDRRLGHLTRRGAVLVMDLDRFKDVNDTLGHQFGDQLLQVISARLLSAVGEVDLAARLGGDEFAVLLDEIASDAELDVRLDLLARQFDRPVELDGITFDVGVSMGVASWPADGETSADLLRRADIAMYEAKRTHQSWVRYRPAIDHSSTRRLQVMGQLREAIERREMTLHYQPQVRADDSCLIGAEALVRWNHPTLGLIPPGEFVTLAEHSGVAAELTRFVLGEAIDATARLRRAGIDLVMAVNLTSRDI
ncbi:MAG: putative bifunctional diguanylate cyclase/phosphodiesterase, partial [Acidimicrobiales bacterium]